MNGKQLKNSILQWAIQGKRVLRQHVFIFVEVAVNNSR